MRIVLFSLCLLSPFYALSQYLWKILDDTVIVKWTYNDGDEFSGSIDNEKWKIGFPWSDKIFTQETLISPENIVRENGTVSFILKKKDSLVALFPQEIDTVSFKKNKIELLNQNQVLFKYTGALLWSRKEYQYGYFELKFRGVVGRGIWPAFWLYGGKPNYEIDFFELKGEKTKSLHVDVHCPDGCANFKEGIFGYRRSWGHWVELDSKLNEHFNVLGVEWAPDFIKWYLNGQLIAFAPIAIQIPMSLSIGTGVAKNNGPFKPGPDSQTPFPNYFTVDYVRIYKQETDSLNQKKIFKVFPSQTYQKPEVLRGDMKAAKKKRKLKNSSPFQKTEKVQTISVEPVASKTLQFRTLGQNDSDSTTIIINDRKGNSLKKIFMSGNTESEFVFEKPQQVFIIFQTKKVSFTQHISVE